MGRLSGLTPLTSLDLEAPDLRGRRPWFRTAAQGLWHRWRDADFYVIPPRSEWSSGLRRLRLIGLCFFVLEFIGFGWWSTVVVNKFALSWDFSINLQAVYQWSQFHWAAHLTTFGNPALGLQGVVAFVRIHGVFLEFLIGMLYRLWPHAILLLWVQNLFIVVSQLVAFVWIIEYLARQEARRRRRTSWLLGTIGFSLLVVNPWILWTISFDYHSEPIGLFMVLLTARAVLKRQRRGFVLAFLAMLTGDVAATYLIGVGVSLALIGRRYWKQGAELALIGLVTSLLLIHFRFDRGSPTGAFNYLIGPHGVTQFRKLSPAKLLISFIERPWRPLGVLWSRHVDIVANIAPSGIIGLFTPWTFTVPAISLLVNALPFQFKDEFIVPFFQNLPDYIIVPLGTVIWLSFLTAARQRLLRVLGWCLALVVVANIVGWAVYWDGTTASHWLPVTPAAAQQLRIAEAMIPPTDEVIASQGIMGLFGARPYLYRLNNGLLFPSLAPNHVTWVVITPEQGIEIQPSFSAQRLITALARNPRAQLKLEAAGVYVFKVYTPSKRVLLIRGPKLAWVTPGDAGTPVQIGPESNWYLSSTGVPGYVLSYDYFRMLAGPFEAELTLSSETPINVEVWDNSRQTMLARESLVGTRGTTVLKVPFTVPPTFGGHIYSGKWIWVIHPTPEPSGDQIEVRVYAVSGQGVKVYGVQMVHHSHKLPKRVHHLLH